MENNHKKHLILQKFFIRCFVVMIFGCYALVSNAQHFLSGFVKDRETGEPLIGASVFIPGTTIGVATSSTGFYVIKLPSQDTLTLITTFIGYQPVIKKIIPGKDKQADFSLKRGVELAEIKVRAPLVSEKKFGASIIEIPAGELRNLPSLGGETDLVRAYQLLPGIQGGTEGKAGLFVRGGGNDQNLVLLDGFPLYYINHLGGFTSLFDPEAVKNFRLYKGGFPARYGNRLSSVLDVSLKEGDKYRARHTLSVGLISGSASSQGPLFQGKGSWFVSLRRMWLDILTRPVTYLAFDGFSTGYNFYDLNAKISLQPNPSDRFFLSLFSGDDKLMLNYSNAFIKPDIKSFQHNKWGNLLWAARWEHSFSPRTVANTRLSFTRYRFLDEDFYRNKKEISGYSNVYRSRIRDIGINSDLDFYISNSWQVKTGGNLILHWFEPGNLRTRQYDDEQVYLKKEFNNASHIWETSLYAENAVTIQKLSFNAGIRLAGYFLPGKSYIYPEPRFSSAYEFLKNTRAKFSYAGMHQFLHMFESQVAGFGTEFWFPSTAIIPPSNSQLITFGVENETDHFQMGIDFYQKRMQNLIMMKEGESFQGNAVDWEKRVEPGTGNAKGMEIFFRKKTGRLTGWLSYTLAKADRQFTHINSGKSFPFQFDRRHDLSVVLSYKLTDKWNFAADWVYGSGYPITLALGRQTVIPGAWAYELNGGYTLTDEGEYYGSKNGFRMKDYHRLDIGFTHTKLKKGKERIWNFSIYNVYNRQNPYYYFYKERKPWQGDRTTSLYQASFLPFLPSVSYTLKF